MNKPYFKNDAVWQWIYHLMLIGLGLIGALIVLLSSSGGEN
jgi:hypothetical protein